MIKTFITLIFACSLIVGNQTKVSAPKIILKDISFDITFSGNFLKDNQYVLEINNDEFPPYKQTKSGISFKNLKISQTGEATFILSQESTNIYKMKKHIIPRWTSVLPPFIAVAFSFATGYDAISFVLGLKEINFIGFDMVLVMPPYDPAHITSLLAANILYKFISLIAI